MKVSEKNVLISTGILIVFVFAMLQLEKKKTAEKVKEKVSIEVASSSYDVTSGKLVLKFENRIEEFDSLVITIIDDKHNTSSGKPNQEQDALIFDTFIPDFNYENAFEIIFVQEDNSAEYLKFEYKIPTDNIITTRT